MPSKAKSRVHNPSTAGWGRRVVELLESGEKGTRQANRKQPRPAHRARGRRRRCPLTWSVSTEDTEVR